MSSPQGAAGRQGAPPPQQNLQRAIELAFEALLPQSEEQIEWLGARPTPAAWALPVLGDELHVDPTARRVRTSDGEPVGSLWTILALHYLAVTSRPETRPPAVTFADLPTARSYASVYQGRVIRRFCATAGREASKLRSAAAALAGRSVDGGDAAFDFAPFPRITLRMIWHAADEEFPASATILLPDNIEEYLVSEDVIVLSECLVTRLGGRPF